VIATNRAAYCRLCWAAAELVLTYTGWVIEVKPLAGPFSLGLGGRAS